MSPRTACRPRSARGWIVALAAVALSGCGSSERDELASDLAESRARLTRLTSRIGELQVDLKQLNSLGACTPAPTAAAPAPGQRPPVRIMIVTDPAGATVFIDGRKSGQTPTEVEISTDIFNVRLEKDGYYTERRTVDARKSSSVPVVLTRSE
jgi:hypothetical protein